MLRYISCVMFVFVIHCAHGMNTPNFIITDEQKELLDKIDKGNTDRAYYYVEKLYNMTEDDIKLLLPIKGDLTNAPCYKDLKIGISYTPVTKLKKVGDWLLLAFPLFITAAVVPHFTYDLVKEKGKIEKIIGGAISCTAGFITGNYLLPVLDSYHSHFLILQEQFGPDHKTVYRKERSFAMLALFHYTINAIAQGITFQTVFSRITKCLLQALRIFSYITGAFDMLPHLLDYGPFIFLLAFLSNLEEYDHPLKRHNKDGNPYTLADLLNAHNKN